MAEEIVQKFNLIWRAVEDEIGEENMAWFEAAVVLLRYYYDNAIVLDTVISVCKDYQPEYRKVYVLSNCIDNDVIAHQSSGPSIRVHHSWSAFGGGP